MSILDKIAQLKLSEAAAAQGVHFLIGFTAVFVPAHYGVNPVYPALAMTGIAAGIEFWFDAKYEKQSFKNNLIDFIVYESGILAAIVLHHFAG